MISFTPAGRGTIKGARPKAKDQNFRLSPARTVGGGRWSVAAGAKVCSAAM
jgi:hypothetical protein